MARRLRSKAGSAIDAQRKAIVEPVNGQIKEARGHPAALPLAGPGGGGWGMAPDRRNAQSAEAVPIQAIPSVDKTGRSVKATGVSVAVGTGITHRAAVADD